MTGGRIMKNQRTREWWVSRLKLARAIWQHPASLTSQWRSTEYVQPHAVLTSGLHTDVMFNCSLLGEGTVYLAYAVEDLTRAYLTLNQNAGGSLPTVVVGPATGATLLAREIAKEIWERNPGTSVVSWLSPRKARKGNKGRFVFGSGRAPRSRDLVLPCDDVITTGSSVKQVIQLCVEGGATVLPYVLCFVNRSGSDFLDGRRILSLIDWTEGTTWDAASCPLCRQGSVTLRDPKRQWDSLFP